ncbi:28S ribosomal protein S5, mitochondrial-like [Oppia nitens]|uniref:28S ribosomal protein S5, mitochondrial-like n=1 Tax=Oppia nitens TaxID=1686743 RepID=UPI0023DB6FCE|nr:28S ribosomal protein S5, mitochondrial-like [Oppia nitens]
MFSSCLARVSRVCVSLKTSLTSHNIYNGNTCLTTISVRNNSSFYTRIRGDQLWKGAMGVSKTSAKRGRKGGGGKIIKHDLNRGQRLGVGRHKMLWPGLNAPVMTGRQTLRLKSLGKDEQFDQNLANARSRMRKFTAAKVHPLERGWSGTRMGGRWIGPPDPVNGEPFIGFDTKVLYLKPIFKMTALFGKYKRFACLTCSGNMNGLAGYAVNKDVDSKKAIVKSKNKAAQRLQYINLCEGNTIYHNFYSKFFATELFVRKMPKGYGIRAHRCVTAICEVLGITDIHCKVEGGNRAQRNYLHITRAFFNGLMKQKSYQEMADEKRLNVVELVGKYEFPKVLARPTSGCRTDEEISADELLDYNMYIYNGRVIQPPKERPMFYTKDNSWETYIKRWQYRQHQQHQRINLIAKYGSLESYLTQLDRQRLSAKKAHLINKLAKDESNEEAKEETQI